MFWKLPGASGDWFLLGDIIWRFFSKKLGRYAYNLDLRDFNKEAAIHGISLGGVLSM